MSLNEGDIGGAPAVENTQQTAEVTTPAPAQTATPAPATAPAQAQATPSQDWNFEDADIPQDMDASFVNGYASIAKEFGMNKENAKQLLTRAVDLARQVDAEAVNQQTQAWVKEVHNDPEIGGVKLNANLAIAKRALKTYDPTGEMQRFLNESGYGNNLNFIKFLWRVGQNVSEDGFVNGSREGEVKSFDNLAERMYGKSN